MLVLIPHKTMKKLLGVFLVLIVIKCYAMAKVAVPNLLVLNDNELPIEGGISVIIAVSLIYGSKVGRSIQNQEQKKV